MPVVDFFLPINSDHGPSVRRADELLAQLCVGSCPMTLISVQDCMSFIRPTCSIEHFHLLGRDLHAGGDLQKTAALVAGKWMDAFLVWMH